MDRFPVVAKERLGAKQRAPSRFSRAQRRRSRARFSLSHVQVHIPGPPFGSAASLDDAMQHFKTASLAFKAKHAPEALAAAYREMNKRDSQSGP